MSRGRLLGVCATAGVVACTPLGLWVYDDPGVEVSRVRVNRNASAAPVVVGLAVWNPNDYDVTTSHLELELKLDDVPVGRFSRDSVVSVPTAGLADVALPLTMQGESARQRLRALRPGTHRFAVEGRATFSTPFGPRKVRLAHRGDLAFGREEEARIATTIAADSLKARGRRGIGIHSPKLVGARPAPEKEPQSPAREARSEPR